MSGRIEGLWLKRSHGEPMDPADTITLVSEKGAQGDVNFGRKKRQVTVIEKEVFDRIVAALPDV